MSRPHRKAGTTKKSDPPAILERMLLRVRAGIGTGHEADCLIGTSCLDGDGRRSVDQSRLPASPNDVSFCDTTMHWILDLSINAPRQALRRQSEPHGLSTWFQIRLFTVLCSRLYFRIVAEFQFVAPAEPPSTSS